MRRRLDGYRYFLDDRGLVKRGTVIWKVIAGGGAGAKMRCEDGCEEETTIEPKDCVVTKDEELTQEEANEICRSWGHRFDPENIVPVRDADH